VDELTGGVTMEKFNIWIAREMLGPGLGGAGHVVGGSLGRSWTRGSLEWESTVAKGVGGTRWGCMPWPGAPCRRCCMRIHALE
jgi:hypothetical protein